jgi:spore maturation protein SpmB
MKKYIDKFVQGAAEGFGIALALILVLELWVHFFKP